MLQEQTLYDDAMAALKKGMRDLAKQRFEDIVSLNPRHALAYANLGQLHFDDERHHDSILNYEKAIMFEPHPQYFNNIGSALIERNRWEDAEACYREAIKLDPNLAIAYNNIGRLYLVRGNQEEAKKAFRQAIKLAPEYPEPRVGLAFTHLELGEFEEGWVEYEWRRKLLPQHRVLPPDFVGQKVMKDDAILVIGEQGMGDQIQFCRYAQLLKKRYGCKVHIEVRPEIVRLIKTLDGIDSVFGYGDPIPEDVKYSIWMMSCPLLFGHFDENQFPRSQSYLAASGERYASYLPYFKYMPPGLKIGFCYAGGGAIPGVDKRRSTTINMWSPLGKVEGASWVSLQKGDNVTRQLKNMTTGMTVMNIIEDCKDMADTAALIMHCDLVISVDTAIAHVAAALGKPTWVLSRRDACWRWLLDRQDSPWYPTVRHYRQKKFNEWPELMERVAVDLQQFVSEHTADLKMAA